MATVEDQLVEILAKLDTPAIDLSEVIAKLDLISSGIADIQAQFRVTDAIATPPDA